MNKTTRPRVTSTGTRRQFLGASSRLLAAVALVAPAAVFLAGCGQKGPLFIPEDDQKKKKKQG